ncbi:MAG: ferrous iron transport protein B [Kiritimatiellae bacterium]|nr:ferrous iron transport protein B [Kiritimatiellia bacterium]
MGRNDTNRMTRPRTIRVALAGNPNVGKTTLFNALTGERQHVGNYPGVTVEKEEGWFEFEGRRVEVVDLPGTLSLTAHSLEERLARAFILEQRPDVVVDIVDASNLERNLYLATQLMALGVRLILAFNKSDLARARGYEIDIGLLEKLLGVTIVPTVGPDGRGIRELKQAILRVAESPAAEPAVVRFGDALEREIEAVTGALAAEPSLAAWPGPRWWAIKLLEGDEEAQQWVRASVRDAAGTFAAVEAASHRLQRDFGDTPGILLADGRYGFISGACQEAVRTTVEARHSVSDQVDAILTHPVFGIPIFLGMMYLVFKLTFTLGAPPMHWIDLFFGWLAGRLAAWWPGDPGGPLLSLLADGVIGGVGGVIVFLPTILLLFLGIALLEDTGYMARAVFIMDKLMHRMGLHGKSFIPMLIGFGCTVPAVMATRIIEGRRDRLATMMVLPLMSCGARLPIYTLIISAFFPAHWQAPMLMLMYVIGIVLAVVGVRVLRATILRGESEPFVMELPPYRLPTLTGLLAHMWDRSGAYLRKAGTLILAVSVVMWALMTYPKAADEPLGGRARAEALAHTYAGRAGRALEPALKLMGFDWKIGTAMIGAFVAKEVFVAQMGIVHAVDTSEAAGGALGEDLRRQYSPLVGFCVMLFMLIGMPCAATVAVTRAESGSWRWALFQLAGLTLLAYILTVAVYQLGTLLGVGI